MLINAKLVIVPTKKEKSELPISLFRLCSNKVPYRKWIKAIPQKNLKICDSCRICVKHFVVIYSNYPYQISKNKNSGNKRVELKIVRSKLRATPLTFSNLTKYLSNEPLLK